MLAGKEVHGLAGGDEVRRAIEASPVRSRILTPGGIISGNPPQIAPELYGAAEALVFSSLYEGFGLPVLEAMACGTPVITSNTGSLPEVAGDAALLVDPTSVEELTLSLERLMQDRSLRSHLSVLGRERASKFPWEHTARQTLQIYQAVLGSPVS